MRDLLHSLLGTSIGASNGASSSVVASTYYGKTIFLGVVQIHEASNGYIVSVARKEGFQPDIWVAANVDEVNEIIMSQVVAFKLEHP